MQTAIVLALVTFVISCTKEKPDLQVGNWGPQSMVLGEIPNKQPDGGLGIWIEVTRQEGPDDVQILFDGVPQVTAFHEKVVTMSVPPKQLTQPGNKEIVIRQVSTGKFLPVGTFVINPKR